jgi:uncharacterized protein (DUF1778 family)
MQTARSTHVEGDRISIRLKSTVKRRFEKAAALDDRSLTSFIIASATEKADNILKSDEQMTLNQQDWKLFFNALANPPKPNAVLKKAFEKYQKINIQPDV